MASISASNDDLIEEISAGSDSDSNLDDDVPEYYQQISAVDDGEEDEGEISDNQVNSDDDRQEIQGSNFHGLSNGYNTHREAENGISSLDLNEDADEDKSDVENEDEEIEVREIPNSEMVASAFREDENRRNAPLTQENAAMVMDAMRGVSFSGLAPDWATRVSEDHWIDRLRRLREPSALRSDTSSTAQN